METDLKGSEHRHSATSAERGTSSQSSQISFPESADAVEIAKRRLGLDTPEDEAERARFREAMLVAQQIHDLRTQAGLSQRALAKLVGTSHSAICRLESADYEGHSLSMLRRIAEALGHRVEVRFVPVERAA